MSFSELWVPSGALSWPRLASSRRPARHSSVESSVRAFWADFQRFQNLTWTSCGALMVLVGFLALRSSFLLARRLRGTFLRGNNNLDNYVNFGYFSGQHFGRNKRAENWRTRAEHWRNIGGQLAETCGTLAEHWRKRVETCRSALQTLACVFWVTPGPESCFLVSRHGDFHSSPMCTKSTSQFHCVFHVEFMSCRSGCHDEASIYVSTAPSSSLRSFAPLRGVSNLQTLINWPLALIAFCRRTFYHRKFIKALLISVERPYPPRKSDFHNGAGQSLRGRPYDHLSVASTACNAQHIQSFP